MSVKRIESAYAYYFDRKMSGAQMAVLQALAYCANEKDGEKCFPSNATLVNMTHLSKGAVQNACKALRDMKAIDWKPGGQFGGMNISNSYTFLFPHTKMMTKRERYERAEQLHNGGIPSAGEGYPNSCPTVPQPLPPGTPTAGEGYPNSWGGVPQQLGSNTECKTQSKPQSNSKSNSKSNSTPPPGSGFDFIFGNVLKPVNNGRDADPRDRIVELDEIVKSHKGSPIQAAMLVCGVTDKYNANTFTRLADRFDKKKRLDVMWEGIETFWGEIKAGEHNGLKKKASVLTTWCKNALATLPPVPVLGF